jgi:putative endonuclease
MDIYEFGRMGERAAASYMESMGYTVIGRNVRVGKSEFDLICKNGRELSFVEVKTRSMLPSDTGGFGPPRSAVNADKKSFLLRGMDRFLRESGLRGKVSARIDVIEVYASASPVFTVHDIKYHRNAVGTTPRR